MKMYETIPEAISIFHASDPATIHTIHDSITGHTITGTAAEVIPALLTYDAEHDDNTSFGPVDTSNAETWAVIEYAYSL